MHRPRCSLAELSSQSAITHRGTGRQTIFVGNYPVALFFLHVHLQFRIKEPQVTARRRPSHPPRPRSPPPPRRPLGRPPERVQRRLRVQTARRLELGQVFLDFFLEVVLCFARREARYEDAARVMCFSELLSNHPVHNSDMNKMRNGLK